MHSEEYLERNLLALAVRQPELAARLKTAGFNSKLEISVSRNSLPVPGFKTGDSFMAFHSLFDPAAEGIKMAATATGADYLLVFGLGAAYHIRPLASRAELNGMLIIEKDLTLFKSLLAALDYTDLILDPRIKFLSDLDEKELVQEFLNDYFPALSGNLKTLSLMSRVNFDKNYFSACADAVKGTLNSLADDFTVQACFGKRWFINTISNLPAAQNSSTVLRPVKKALIAGAGPSLELFIDEIASRPEGCCLIATDTALPALKAFSIKPDIVITIDCQHISYNHFISGIYRDIPLVADLASPSSITRLTDRLFFFSSGHPFSRYVSREWRAFPGLDVSGGNVSHTAVSLALSLGAKEITLYGTDFAYPEGKSYSRGTYIYPYFMADAVRFSGLESRCFSFMLRNRNIEKKTTDGKICYTTRPMINYRDRMEKAYEASGAAFIHRKGFGLDLNLPVTAGNNQAANISSFFSAGSCRNSWADFLENYRKKLAGIPEFTDPLAALMSTLSADQKDLVKTMYPAASSINNGKPEYRSGGAQILEMTREWTLNVLEAALNQNRKTG